MATEKMIVVETDYNNHTFTLDEDNLYIVVVDDTDEADFQDTVIGNTVDEDWDLKPVGTIAVQVYEPKRKDRS